MQTVNFYHVNKAAKLCGYIGTIKELATFKNVKNLTIALLVQIALDRFINLIFTS
jgi:hypothetical protein